MRFLSSFARRVDRLNGWIGAGLRWLALAMVLIGAYNAVARYITRFVGTQLSSNALFELQWYLFSIIFLLGAAYGLERDVHVRVDVLYSRFGPGGRAWIDLAGSLLFLIPFSVLMLVVSWPAVMNSWSIRETSPDPGGLARYPIKALLLVSFGLLVLQGLSEVIKSVEVIRGERERRHEPDELVTAGITEEWGEASDAERPGGDSS